MKQLKEISSVEELAGYIAENYPSDTYTEHEGIVYPDIAVAGLISSYVRDYNRRRELAFVPYADLKVRINTEYKCERDGAKQIVEKILMDKICGCKELCAEFLALPPETWTDEFGCLLQNIYPAVKSRGGARYNL